MEICTTTPFIQKAREGVLEFLLLQHPLDCPICDQAGECDLQDQYMHFGVKFSRQFFIKRSLEDKIFTPTLKTIMTRCIHCTRCIRFFAEICNLPVLGTLNRGLDTEIGTYSAIPFYSELSGNVVDLCPVGALTLRASSFRFRPWEIFIIDGFDLTDGLNTPIIFHALENTIGRILPKKNQEIGAGWISDKVRFCSDAVMHLKSDQNFLFLNIVATLSSTMLSTFYLDSIYIILSKFNSCEDFRLLKSLMLLSKFYLNLPISGSLLTAENYKSNFYMSDVFNNNFSFVLDLFFQLICM